MVCKVVGFILLVMKDCLMFCVRMKCSLLFIIFLFCFISVISVLLFGRLLGMLVMCVGMFMVVKCVVICDGVF